MFSFIVSKWFFIIILLFFDVEILRVVFLGFVIIERFFLFIDCLCGIFNMCRLLVLNYCIFIFIFFLKIEVLMFVFVC